MNRRTFLLSVSAAMIARPVRAAECGFEICRSEAEWRARLSDAAFRVLREEETERPYTSPLNEETRPGVYHCRGCELPVYDAAAKYDSGTGWPSFTKSLPGAVGTKEDRTLLFQVRTEVHCRRCGGHLGHIFDDGPPPTGKRHCLNGVSLLFKPAA
ncbi:peptide-methionine (R)-S-oxide reductase MsrB [Stappia sp.]|uniref:peptide-methionine (R)-S-oxide reductase MsrB n=1 Tax=Stappia sp. TaxID=1870903 RepID=UPI0032D94EB8